MLVTHPHQPPCTDSPLCTYASPVANRAGSSLLPAVALSSAGSLGHSTESSVGDGPTAAASCSTVPHVAEPKLWPVSTRKINYLAPFCNTSKDCLPGTVACADVCSGRATVVLRKGTESSYQWSHTAAMGMDRRSTAMPAGAWGGSRALGSCEGRLRSCFLDHMGCAV